MNETFVARAPGKLFLLGEYAVLDGAPAVLAAVDRYVEVRLRVAGTGITRVAAPGHCEAIELHPGGTAADRPELRFALASIEAAVRKLPRLANLGLDIEIRSHLEEGAESGRKIGLGGSAAVTTGIVAALFAAAGADLSASRDDVFATAFAAHRSAQNGVGSGADVAASVYGGALLFEPRPESLPRVRQLDLPEGTRLLVGWSGQSAATTPLVRDYLALDRSATANPEHRLRHTPSEARPRCQFLRDSRLSVDAFLRALDGGWLSARSVNDNGEALERLGDETGLPVFTTDLARLVGLARAAGAGAKLSGAGGGDCAIALTDDAEVAERVRASWRAASLTLLDVHLEHGGVSVAQS